MADFRRLMRRLPALVVPIVLAVSATGVISSHAARRQTPSSGANAVIVTVRDESVGRPIPSSFLGLSFEFPAITRYAEAHGGAVDPLLVQLIRNLTPGQDPVLRIGGKSTDATWWPVAGKRPPRGARVLTQNWLNATASLASQLSASLILGINLKAASRTEASAEASAFESSLGPSIEALELGYKPELYPRFAAHHGARASQAPASRTRPTAHSFGRAYSGLATAVQGPLAGPAAGAPAWSRQLGSFLAGQPRVRLATLEASPLDGCFAAKDSSRYPTISHLLDAAASGGFVSGLGPAVRGAHSHQVPLRIDELNTLSCGSVPAVSSSFAAALWALDTLFQMVRTGVDGINIQASPGEPGALFRFMRARRGWMAAVAPEYYGLMMFAQATPPGSRLVRVSTKDAAGVEAWATRGPDAHFRLVLINTGSGRRTVRVKAGGVAATLERLEAPSRSATHGARLGGRGFGKGTSSGRLSGRPDVGKLKPRHGYYALDLPASSAALLDVSAPGLGVGAGFGGPGSVGAGASGPGPAPPSNTAAPTGSGQKNCMSQLQSDGVHPAWPSVAACGYPTPTSLDPNGMSSGGTAGVPDGTALKDVRTCGCLPPGDGWNGSGGYLSVNNPTTLSGLYIPGTLYIAGNFDITVQNSDVETDGTSTGDTVDGNGDTGTVTLSHDWIHDTYNGNACRPNPQNLGIANFGGQVNIDHSDIDCLDDGVIPSTSFKLTNSVVMTDVTEQVYHTEPIYIWPDEVVDIENNTLVNPDPGTAGIFGDANAGGTLSNITVKNNLVAGNQDNGGVLVGCTAGNGYSADFGHYPSTNIVVEGNRFTKIYNVNPPGGGFLAGNTDDGPGTTWTGNFMDNNLSTVAQPGYPC
jgi:hypothetical protein